MPGPWEKYQRDGGTAVADDGPWRKYAAKEPASAKQPNPEYQEYLRRFQEAHRAVAAGEDSGIGQGLRVLGRQVVAPALGGLFKGAAPELEQQLRGAKGPEEETLAGLSTYPRTELTGAKLAADAMPLTREQFERPKTAEEGRAAGKADPRKESIFEAAAPAAQALDRLATAQLGPAEFSKDMASLLVKTPYFIASVPKRYKAWKAAIAAGKADEAAAVLAKAKAEEEAAFVKQVDEAYPKSPEVQPQHISTATREIEKIEQAEAHRMASARFPKEEETPIVILDDLKKLHEDIGGFADPEKIAQIVSNAFRQSPEDVIGFTRSLRDTLGAKAVPAAASIFRKLKTAGGYAPKYNLPAEASEFMVKTQSAGRTLERVMKTPIEDAAEGLRGGIKALITGKPNEAKWVRDNFVSTVRAGADAPADMPGAQRLLDTWRGIAKQIPEAFEAVGKKIGTVENYFPQRWTEKFREAFARQKGDLYEAWKVKALEMNPDISPERLASLSDEIAKGINGGDFVAETKAFQKGRMFKNMPESVLVDGKMVDIIERDPFKVMDQYLSGVGRQLGKYQTSQELGYGAEFGKVEDDIVNWLTKEHGAGQASQFREQMRMVHGEGFTDDMAKAARVARPVVNLARGLALTTTAIPNALLGYVPVLSKVGAKHFLKTAGRIVTGKAKEDIELGRRLGGWTQDVLSEMTTGFDTSTVSGRLSRFPVKWTGGEAANRGINKFASVAAKSLLDDAIKMANKGDRKLFDGMMKDMHFGATDAERMLASGPGDFDYGRVMQLMSSRTNLAHEFAVDAPRWVTHPLARDAFAYTGIVRTIGNAAADAVGKAARGDVMPLVYLVGGTALGNEAKLELVRRLKGRADKKRTWGDVVADTILDGAMLGMAGNYISEARWGKKRGEKPWQSIPRARVKMYEKGAELVYGIVTGDARIIRRGMPVADIAAVQTGSVPLDVKERLKLKSPNRRKKPSR